MIFFSGIFRYCAIIQYCEKVIYRLWWVVLGNPIASIYTPVPRLHELKGIIAASFAQVCWCGLRWSGNCAQFVWFNKYMLPKIYLKTNLRKFQLLLFCETWIFISNALKSDTTLYFAITLVKSKRPAPKQRLSLPRISSRDQRLSASQAGSDRMLSCPRSHLLVLSLLV